MKGMGARLKRFLLDTFCKSEINAMYFSHLREIGDIERKLKETEVAFKEEKRKNSIPKRIFTLNNSNVIIAVETTKYNEECFIVKNESSRNLELYVYSTCSNNRMNDCRIYGERHIHEDGSFHIKIIDFIGEENQGYGSILMPHFIKEAKKLGAQYITGRLSDVDKGHFDRSEHFYKKHGFTVSFNAGRTSGNIRLDLL